MRPLTFLVSGWGVPLMMLLVLMGAIEFMRPGLFAIDSIGLKVAAAMTLILVATGETIVVLRGGIDLSVGGTLSLASAIAATRPDLSGTDLLPWLALILAMGLAVGVANGVLISALKLQPFLITLATWSIIEGIALIVQPSEGGTVPRVWFALGYSTVAGVPIAVVILVVLCLWWACFRGTRTFNALRSAGSNERSAFLNRVSLVRTNVIAYGLSGFFAALAGFFYATQTGAGSPTVGTQYVLPAIAAVVIGGTSLAGGRGGLTGTIIGAFILNLIGDAVFLLGLSSYWQFVTQGAILIFIVSAAAFGSLASEMRR
jgi:ribose transport system permease protein